MLLFLLSPFPWAVMSCCSCWNTFLLWSIFFYICCNTFGQACSLPFTLLLTILFIQTWSDEAKKVLHELMEQSFAKPFIEPVDVEQCPVSTISLVMVNPNPVITPVTAINLSSWRIIQSTLSIHCAWGTWKRSCGMESTRLEVHFLKISSKLWQILEFIIQIWALRWGQCSLT